MNQQIHLFHKFIITCSEISTSIAICYQGIFTTLARFLNKSLHVGFKLIESSLLIRCLMNTLIAQRETKNNVFTAIMDQVVETSQ